MRTKLGHFGAELTAKARFTYHLSPKRRTAICSAVAAGKSQRAVVKAFKVQPSTVSRTIQRWKSRQSFDRKPGQGRPSKLSTSEKRYIVNMVKRNRRLALKALIHEYSGRVSRSTIKRVLRMHHMRKWKAAKRIPLSKDVAADRYRFACEWLPKVDELEQVS
jgi:transposase